MGIFCIHVAKMSICLHPPATGYKHSPTICHCLVAEHLDECPIHPDLLITHYIDDILIQGPDEHLVQCYLDQMVTPLKQKGWEINPDKIQRPAQEVTFLGIRWNFEHRAILPKARQKILDFAPPRNKKEAHKVISLFRY